jgi:putative ABC transport system permease protein
MIHLRSTIRNLAKRKGYTLLNLGGLVIGMTSCLLIFHYVSYERSYDDFHPKAKQIARLRLDSYQKGQLAWKSATVYPAIAPTIKKDYPEVENFCRLHDADLLLTNEETNVKFSEHKGYFADPSTLQMFDIRLIKGNPATALDAPDKMVISESMARKYFGNQDAMAKRLVVRDPGMVQTYEVTGVFKDYPSNSHLDIKYLVSYATLGKIMRHYGDTSNAVETSFGWYDFYSYIQLKPGVNYKQLEGKLPFFTDHYINSNKWYKANNVRAELHLLPLTDIHLYSNYNQEAEVNGNGQAVSFLFLIALLIICIAWINYINLATARSVERAKEVGVRKVLGASRAELMRQFLAESLLLNLVACVISFGLFFALLRPFDFFTGRSESIDFALTRNYWLLFAGLFLLGTFLSGIYPAFVLSAFQPIRVLKGAFKNTSRGIILRKGLIVAQFVTSVILIAGTIIVFMQVSYMRSQQLGVNINQTLVLRGAGSIRDSLYMNVYQPFKEDLLRQPAVKSVAVSSSVMGDEIYWTSGYRIVGDASKTSSTMFKLGIDYDFLPAYNLKLIAGRNFSKDFPTDEHAVLLNERAVEMLGFKNPEDAINKKVTSGDTVTVVGVVSNYHHQGLQKAIDPMAFLLRPDQRDYYSLKVETPGIQQTIASIQKIWNKHFPADPMEYFFLDESFNKQYTSDILFGKVFGVFAFLAILIACFGLLGLTAYNVLQRTKEIGIRKVLGASAQSILLLLSKDFMRLIIISLLCAIPIGWLVMNRWLQDFAYRIDIKWWVFAAAGIISLLIAMITICLQAFKSVIENPVKSLHTE